MSLTTRIGDKDVPIERGELITVRFSGGHREGEAGVFEFWTVFNDRAIVTGRCLQDSDPGERFRRMEGKEEYGDAWKVAATAKGIRPATKAEVIKWLRNHKEDAVFVESGQIGGRAMSVVKGPDGLRFV